MSWTIGTVTLPKSPEKIKHDLPALYEAFPVTGGSPDILGTGLEVETLSFTVPLAQRGYTIPNLIGSYLTPLLNMRGSAVALSTPFSSLNGTYLCVGVSPDYDNHKPDEIDCIIKFVKGDVIEVL
jgi:hypothetical protein